jgi:TrmH family RNA methyltransferase
VPVRSFGSPYNVRVLSRVRIVLVSPSGPANVGAASRAMANMGLADLVLVAPRCDVQDEAAIAYAAHGRSVLDAARVVPDIPAALAGCVRSYATSSKLGLYRRQAAITPADAAAEALRLAASGPVAFAFGREDHGLPDRELLHFDRIVSIPAAETYPVLNLAAAVAIVCYELHRARLALAGQPPLPMALDFGAAPDEKKRVMFERLFDALDVVGFFFGQNPDHLKYALRHLLGRVDLSVNEVDILIGMARQIRWYVDHHPQRIDPQ